MENIQEHFDYQKMREHVGDDPEIILEVIILCRKELIASTNQLIKIIDNGDLQEIKKFAHKLHGITSTVALPILMNITEQLEKIEYFNKPQLHDIYFAFEKETEILIRFMDAFIIELP